MKIPSFKINFILLFLILSTFVSYSQEQEIAAEKGILITKKDSSSTLFLKENKRIKVKLLDGKVYVGKLVLIDDKTFSIRGTVISLDSVAKIKRRSVVATIFTPIIIYFGSLILFAGILIAVIYEPAIGGIIISGIGLSTVLTASISQGHIYKKWNYSIGTNPKNKKPVPN